jgi:hypothetical protein
MNKNQFTLSDMLPIIEQTLSGGGEFDMVPSGVSMLPTICGGADTITLAAVNGRLRRYDMPLYRRADGSFVLHRVIGFRGGGYIMCGDAQLVPEHGIKPDCIIGVVRRYRHKGKTIECSGLRFRMNGMKISVRRTFRRAVNKIKHIFTKK